MQNIFGLAGNCESATLATLLEIPLEDVPSFWVGINKEIMTPEEEGIKYQENLNNFLKTKGYTSISLGTAGEVTQDDVDWVIDVSKGIKSKHLVVGKSPRGYNHSVIYENGKL